MADTARELRWDSLPRETADSDKGEEARDQSDDKEHDTQTDLYVTRPGLLNGTDRGKAQTEGHPRIKEEKGKRGGRTVPGFGIC